MCGTTHPVWITILTPLFDIYKQCVNKVNNTLYCGCAPLFSHPLNLLLFISNTYFTLLPARLKIHVSASSHRTAAGLSQQQIRQQHLSQQS